MIGQTQNQPVTAPVKKQWYESLFETAIPAVTQAYAQKELIDLNLKRARQGLPPIEASQVAPAVQVTTDPQMKALLWAALGLGGLFLLSHMKR